MRKLGWKRFIKLKYLLLLRSPGGGKMVAKGFAIGLAVEFITLLTAGVAFLLIFPLLRLFKGSLPSAMIGFLLGKLILPMCLPVGMFIGNEIFRIQTKIVLPIIGNLGGYLNSLLGMLTIGVVVGAISYFPVYKAYTKFQESRKEKRKLRIAQ